MVAITTLYLWTLAFSFDLSKDFLFATFSLINQLSLNLYNFLSNDAYEWVSGILTYGLNAILQLSKIRGDVDGHSSSSFAAYWWFISFCRCLWLKIWCCCCCCGALGFDVIAAMELLDLMMLLLWSSWIDVAAIVELLDLMLLLLWSSWIWCCCCCGALGLPLGNIWCLP